MTAHPRSAEQAVRAGVRDPELMAAALALAENRLPDAEATLRAYLKRDPFQVAAIRLMAELAARVGRFGDSEKLLRRALELAPDFTAARANLATVLHRQNRSGEAIAVLDGLLEADPDNVGLTNMKAAASGRIGEFEEALRLYDAVLARRPDQPQLWMSRGHVLKTLGRTADSIAAYRTALVHEPRLGEVWWSLANLKTFRFTDADITAMEAALARGDLRDEDRFHLDFALGKAREDRGAAAAAFAHYAEGNRLRRTQLPYDKADTSELVDRMVALLTPALMQARAGQGNGAPDPIFILGMPRAGSTLIEQVLSSHSMVEGTMELPDIPELVRMLRKEGRKEGRYPEMLATLPAERLQQLGAAFLQRTRIQRKTDRPFFIDKLPNNWMHAGFIRLILPNATIIDARRHPLACCFSNFKQHFARGQAFSYALDDLGAYYADYVRLMAHLDAIEPGRIIRVRHEDMLADTEATIRRLLARIGLPFEPACLSFWETERAVRTASSEQVRQPIFQAGAEAWKPFDPWLGPLKAALGPALDLWHGGNDG